MLSLLKFSQTIENGKLCHKMSPLETWLESENVRAKKYPWNELMSEGDWSEIIYMVPFVFPVFSMPCT